MREILFRAWDKTNNLMLDHKDLWIHIYPQKYISEISSANIPDYHICDIDKLPNENYYDARTDLVIMQFTGLYDINGKEIFEGDIIKKHFEYSEIEIIKDIRFLPTYDLSKSEIIGNIFENPELITN